MATVTYIVWDRAAHIEFLKLGKTELCAKFCVTDEALEDIIAKTNDGSQHFAEFNVDVTDTAGDIVAKVRKTIYIRRKQRVTSKL